MSYFVALTDIVSWPYSEHQDAIDEVNDILEKSSINELICKGDVCIGIEQNTFGEKYYVYDSEDVIYSGSDLYDIENSVESDEENGNMIILEELSCDR